MNVNGKRKERNVERATKFLLIFAIILFLTNFVTFGYDLIVIFVRTIWESRYLEAPDVT